MTPGAGPDALLERIEAGLRRLGIPAALCAALAHEGALWTYAFAGWWMRTPVGKGNFSVYRGTRSTILAVGIGLVLLVARWIPAHILLVRVGWVVTALTAYGLLWLAGDAHGVRLRPLRIDDGHLWVRTGLRWRASVPLAQIASVEPLKSAAVPSRWERGYLSATPLGVPTLLLTLRAPVTARGPYGLPRVVTRIGVAPDSRARFVEVLEKALAGVAPAP